MAHIKVLANKKSSDTQLQHNEKRKFVLNFTHKSHAAIDYEKTTLHSRKHKVAAKKPDFLHKRSCSKDDEFYFGPAVDDAAHD